MLDARPRTLFYERQRMRVSIWNIPRFLRAYDENLDGGLVMPRGMLDTVTDLAAQAGSRLEFADERTPGTQREFTFTATLTAAQIGATADLSSIGNPRYQNLLNVRRDTCAA
jgi:hypothetical protein